MYKIRLDNRFEVIHPADGALAIVNTLRVEKLWGSQQLLLIGGGPKCQMTYRDYLFTMLKAVGIGSLPEELFSKDEYVTDWLDSKESQRLLRYQRHSFQEIATEISDHLGWKRHLIPIVRRFERKKIIKMSPYYKDLKGDMQSG
jgi:hypothetical protein